jgi:hypothetical protein
MSMLGIRASVVLLLVLSGLWGCAGNETKPVMDEQPVAESEKANLTPMEKPEEQGVSEAKESEVPEPVVETIPRKEESAPIILEPIPEPAMVAEPEMDKSGGEEASSKVMKQQVSTAVAESASPAPIVVEGAATSKVVSSKETLPQSTGPNHFVISVGEKNSNHPFFGKGHVMGFVVNGVQGKPLVLERGKTYTFDVRTDPKHDVYISRKAIGWGGAPYAEGVTGAYTYNGTMTFTPGKDTPDSVYYACRNHPYMGGVIHVVDPGESADLLKTPGVSATAGNVTQVKTQVSEAKVRQKIMFAEMMTKSQGAKRVMGSQNAEAKQLLNEAKQSVEDSKAKMKTGALDEALGLADKALKLVGSASRMVPSEEAVAEQAAQYQALLKEISNYEASHEQNYNRLLKAGNKPPKEAEYDKAAINKLKAEAAQLAEQKNYVKANALLQNAQQTITVAIQKMLHSKTLVYDLNFETPKDEFDYEKRRFIGYEELIPVAIEAKKPAQGAIKLMESFLEKARKRRDEAEQKAAEGAYPEAIAMMQQATKTVRRALRMVGVSQ